MNKPKIRFKGFEGEWKERRIGDICNVSTGKSNTQDKVDDGKFPFYVRSPHIEKSNKYLYDEEAVLTVGDGVGTGKVFHYVNGKYDLHQRVYRLYDFKGVNALCFYYYFSQKFYKRVMAMTAKSSVDSVRLDFISEMHLPFPSLPEQRALASYFTSLDAQIAASTSRLSSLKQIKAASLLNMFPQKGETVPRVRFKGFQGEWKEMQFGVAFEYQRNNSLSRAELSDEGIVANIHYGDVLIKYGDCLDVSKDVLTYVKDKKIGMALYKKGALRNGDVIFADAAENNTVGKCTEVICEENVCIVSGLHTIACRPQVEVVERYLGCSLNSPSFHNQLLPHIQGTKISSISKNALSSTSIFLPSLPEQRAIASYFTALDVQITLHRERLEKLKQIKAACLEKMFA